MPDPPFWLFLAGLGTTLLGAGLHWRARRRWQRRLTQALCYIAYLERMLGQPQVTADASRTTH